MAQRTPQPCGTKAAYLRHWKAGEEACRPCKDAMAAYARERYEPKHGPARPLKPCGTEAAWWRHYNAGEEPCGPCAEAFKERERPMADRTCESCGRVDRIRADHVKRRPVCRSCAQRKHWPSSPIAVVTCEGCGDPFTAHGSGMRQRNRCGGCPSSQIQSRPLLFVSGFCAWCGGAFTILYQVQASYCSKSCARKSHRAASGRFLIPDHERQAIYERDGWVCQLCDESVDPDLDPSDVWSATLDHIIPRSHTLVPDDSPENLQLAHRWCNSVKGDGRFYDEEILKAG